MHDYAVQVGALLKIIFYGLAQSLTTLNYIKKLIKHARKKIGI